MSYPMNDYLPLTNVQVFANANWTGLLYTFPTGFINGGRNSITCKDETAPQRLATCVADFLEDRPQPRLLYLPLGAYRRQVGEAARIGERGWRLAAPAAHGPRDSLTIRVDVEHLHQVAG